MIGTRDSFWMVHRRPRCVGDETRFWKAVCSSAEAEIPDCILAMGGFGGILFVDLRWLEVRFEVSSRGGVAGVAGGMAGASAGKQIMGPEA